MPILDNTNNSNKNTTTTTNSDKPLHGLAECYSDDSSKLTATTTTTTTTSSPTTTTTTTDVNFEGVQLNRFLNLYSEVLKHSHYFDNVDNFHDEDDDNNDSEEQNKDKNENNKKKENDKDNNKNDKKESLSFQTIRSSIPMSHSNALLHMKQILWHNPTAFTPDRIDSRSFKLKLQEKQQQQQQQISDSKQQQLHDQQQQQQQQQFDSLESIKSSELFCQFLFDLLNDKNDVMRMRAFQLLQEYCQSLQPASISKFNEPLIRNAVSTLMKIIDTTSNTDVEHLVASSALISLVVARDDPNLTFKTINYILNSKYQSFLPSNLKKINENYIPLERFDFKPTIIYEKNNSVINNIYSMTTNGIYIFVHCDLGLLKLELQSNPPFQFKVAQWKMNYHVEGDDDSHVASSSSSASSTPVTPSVHSWMFIIDKYLYFRSSGMSSGIISQIAIDTFEESFVSAEVGDCPLGKYPYTLFQTTLNNDNINNNDNNNSKATTNDRIAILELVYEPIQNVFPQARLRYLSLVDGAFIQDGPSQILSLWNTTTVVQQVNTNIINEKQDEALLKSLELYKISKIFTSVKGGLYFLSEDKNFYFIGKNNILAAENKPILLSVENQSNTVSKVLFNEPREVLILDSAGSIQQMGRITAKQPSNFKIFDKPFKTPLPDKKTPTTTKNTFQGPFIDISKSSNHLYAINEERKLARVNDEQVQDIELPFKVKSIFTTEGSSDDNWCYILPETDSSDKTISLTTSLTDDSNTNKEVTSKLYQVQNFDAHPKPVENIGSGHILLLHARYTNVYVVTSEGVYVKGSNVFGQLGTGNYKDVKEFTKISNIPFQVDRIEKIEIGLTFTLFLIRNGSNREIYYTGNIGDLKQINSFDLYIDRKATPHCVELIQDISANDYGFSILKQSIQIDLQTIEKKFSDVKVFSDRQCMGVLMPNHSDYLLFNTLTNPHQFILKSEFTPRSYPFHLSKYASFEFNTDSQQLVMLDNQERYGHPFNPRVSFLGPKERVDPLVLVNSLLERYLSSNKLNKLTIPSIGSEYVKSLPKLSFTINKLTVKEGSSARVSTTFVTVNKPVLIWDIILVRAREYNVTVKIESNSSQPMYSHQHRLQDSKVVLDYPYELHPNVNYRISIISTELESVLSGSYYSVIELSGVKFDFTPPVEFKQMPQVLHGLTFAPLPSSSVVLRQPSLREKSVLSKDAIVDLLDSIQTMWLQFSGSIDMHKSLQNGAKDRVVDVLLLLEEPLTRALNLLSRNIEPLFDDVIQGPRFIELIHNIYRHNSLFNHTQPDHDVVIALIKCLNNIFTKSFTHIYASPLQQVSAVHMLYTLVQYENGVSTFPCAPYLLTSMLESLTLVDVKSMIDLHCEEDAFTREDVHPTLIEFFDVVQNEIYQLQSSMSKKSQKQKVTSQESIDNASNPLFRTVLMSIASKPSTQLPKPENLAYDDYRTKSIDLLKYLWSSSLDVNKDNIVYNQPKVSQVGRFNSISSSWSYDDMIDAISFKTDTDLYVTGVGLYGDKGSYNVRVGYNMGPSSGSFNANNSVTTSWTNKTKSYIHRIDFPEPFHLNANEIVTIFTKISGPSSSSGYKGKESVSAEGVTFKFMTAHVNSDNGTSQNSGQIPSIYFQMEPNYKPIELTPRILEDTFVVSRMIMDRSRQMLKEFALQRNTLQPSQLDEIRNDRFLQNLVPFIIDSYSNVKCKSIDQQQKLETLLDFLDSTTKINSVVQNQKSSLKLPIIADHQSEEQQQQSYYIKMESSHPYEECTKQTNVVEFPKDVKWMTIQFDQRSITNQASDRLFVWMNGDYQTPLTKEGFSKNGFPITTFIVPGNKLIFDFQSASNPANFNENNRFGYCAMITGFKVDDNLSAKENYPLATLERQLSFYILQISSSLFFEQKEKGFLVKSQMKASKPVAAAGAAVRDRAKKKKKKGADDSDSDSEEQESDDDETIVDASKQFDDEEELDFDKFKIDPNASNKDVVRSTMYFKDVWNKLSKRLEANPNHEYSITDPLLLDFLNNESGTLGEELNEFFDGIGMELFNKDKKKDEVKKDADKKKDKEKEKEKDKDKNKDKEKDKDNENDDAPVKSDAEEELDEQKQKEKKIEDKFKAFPINNQDIQTISQKLRMKRLALLMARKKHLDSEFKEQKKNIEDEINDDSDDSYDSSDESGEDDSDSSEESESGESWDELIISDNDDEEKAKDEDDEEKEEEEEEEEEESSSCAVAVAAAAEAVDDNTDENESIDQEDEYDDKPTSSNGHKNEQDRIDSEEVEDEKKTNADAVISESFDSEKKEKVIASIIAGAISPSEKENITSFLKYTGWDTIMKKLFVELIRLNGAEQEFSNAVQSIKNQKKSFQEAKDSDSLRPFVELWRNIQRRLNKWALLQTIDEGEEFEGISNLFGDDDYYTPEPVAEKKNVLPIKKLMFLFDFLTHLTPTNNDVGSSSKQLESSSSSSSASSSAPTENSSRLINYSFEEFMNSGNINASTYNLLVHVKKQTSTDSSESTKDKINSSVTSSILAMFIDNFISIDFFATIEEAKRKNLVKIDSLKIWSNLIEQLQVPSALENVVWMIATILHNNQAPKALLPADWQGRVAQNLAITSNIHPLQRKEFILQFHTLLETLSKRIKFGNFSDSIILNALSCFSIYLLPEDIAFVQSSEIFPLISKILSELHSNESRSLFSPVRKGKEKITPQELELLDQQQSESASASSTTSSTPTINSVASLSSSTLLAPIQNSSFVNIANKCKVLLTKSPEMMPSLFDESTQSFWEASSKSLIYITLPGDKPAFVQEVCVYIDNGDGEHQVMSVKVKGGNNESCSDIMASVNVDHECNNWNIIPICASVTNLVISFTGSESIRVHQLKILIPDKQENIPLTTNSKFDATLSLLKLLTFQIFGISTNKEISKDLKNQVANLLSSTGVSKIQKQIFSLISSEVQKEIIHIDGVGWSSLVDQPNKDSYLYELLTTLSSLMESDEGKSFIPSKSSIFALLPLLHKGSERIQHLSINICKRMLINLKPALFAEFMQDQSNVTISNLSFIQYMLLIVAKPIYVQVKGGSNPLAQNYSIDTLLPNVLEGELSLANGKELIELLKELMQKSESWRQAIEDEMVNSILGIRIAATQPINTYLNTARFWAAMSSLLIVFGNQKVINTINSSNLSSEDQVKTCQNHDDGVTEACALCTNCQLNLCGECDRFLHLPKSKRDHQRSPLVNDVIAIEVHENCIRLKLSSTLFVLDCEKQKAIIQTINISSSETCRFCKQKLDLQNLIPSHGISGVCSSAECKQKAALSCTKIHQCGHPCYGIRDEVECLPCLHGCSQPESNSTTTSTTDNHDHSHSGSCKKLTQDLDDFCMICWTETLSEAPSIQLECGHVFHQECSKQLLERRWNGARITLGFSKCPICKISIHHPSLKPITSVIDNIASEIIRKGKLRIDFLGIQKDPLLMPGGKYENNIDAYIMEQFAYYLCHKCKQPYFGGSNQCAAAIAAPEKFNPEELICGGCSSDDIVLPICPKHGKDYLEFKCRYCCSVAIWFCFGTHHFCETCHNRHTELTGRSSHPQCPVGPGGIELPGDDCPLHVTHPKTGTEYALGCGICRNIREF